MRPASMAGLGVLLPALWLIGCTAPGEEEPIFGPTFGVTASDAYKTNDSSDMAVALSHAAKSVPRNRPARK